MGSLDSLLAAFCVALRQHELQADIGSSRTTKVVQQSVDYKFSHVIIGETVENMIQKNVGVFIES